MLVTAMRSPPVPWSASALALVALSCSAIACGSDEAGKRNTASPGNADAPRCRVGSERPGPAAFAPERGIVLACGRTTGGSQIELYALAGDHGVACINIAGLPGGTRACGVAPSDRVPRPRTHLIGDAVVQRSPGAPLELYGAAAPDVQSVVLRFQSPRRRPGQRAATLIRARDRGALKAARIERPFGYFLGSVPDGAEQIWADARDGAGRVVGRFDFDPLRSMHPTVFIAEKD